jgi:hypothetical protein
MIIVGGTYDEHVIAPQNEDLAGSGLRAAAALAADADVRLITAVDPMTQPVADSVFMTYGVNATVIERDEPVGFQYFTPMSPPSIDGPSSSHSASLAGDDDTALVFGMVEGGPRDVRARRLVFDPQRPRDLAVLDLDGLRADQTTIVANAREIRALARGTHELQTAAVQVLRMCGAEAVIVKDSARGCLVATKSSDLVARVGPFPTTCVWPLGSGDVFAAAYAHAWSRGAEPEQAARIASSSAAWWCATRSARVPADILGGTPVSGILSEAAPELRVPDAPPLIYLAAPFFTLAERWLVELCRKVLWGLGAEVFSPLHDVGPGGDEVAARDLDGLEEADAVLALLDGWDPGTVYEVGWAHRKGLPVVGFLNGSSHEGTKMLVGTGAELHQDLSSALYRAVWAGQGHPLVPTRMAQ